MNRRLNVSIFKKNLTRKFQIAKFISLMFFIQGLFMSLLSYREKNFSVFFISAFYSTLMLTVFIYTTITKKLQFFYGASIFLILYLEINFMINGGTEGFGIIWFSLIPLFTIYLFETLGFYIINSILLLILLAGFWTPLNQFLYPFKESFMNRFPLVYIIAFIFSAFLKNRIKQTEQELIDKTDLLSKEINQASIIQKAFLSHPDLVFPHWSLAYKNTPMAGVTGDLYDFYYEDKELKGVGIFDISGHGVSSGMLTMLIKNIIQFIFYENFNNPLSRTMELINERFIKEKGGVTNYLTGILAKINESQIELVNAGHQYPIHYRKSDNTFNIIKKSPESMGAIGLKGFPCVYVSQFIQMESGDELFFFSDGITEARNAEDVQFGMDRFIDCLKKNINATVDEQLKYISVDVHSFIGKTPVTDDMTLLILKRD